MMKISLSFSVIISRPGIETDKISMLKIQDDTLQNNEILNGTLSVAISSTTI